MNYLTVDLYRDFHCIADACPNTCCAGWRITIDRQTYEKMLENEEQLGTPAKDWLIDTGYNDMIIAKLINNRCSMLDENNLCKVVLKLGPEYLSQTCKIYPRHHHYYGNIIEGYLSMSCPDVIMKLMDKKNVQFDFFDDDKTCQEYEYTNLYLFESAVRTISIDTLQNYPDVSLNTRLFVVFKILENAVALYQNAQFDTNVLMHTIEAYLQTDTLFSLDNQLQEIINQEARYHFIQQLPEVMSNHATETDLAEYTKQTLNYFRHTTPEEYLSDFTAFKTNIQHYHTFYTNYWVYRIFADGIKIPDYQHITETLLYIAAEFCLIQTFALASFVNNRKLDRDEYIHIISCVNRLLI